MNPAGITLLMLTAFAGFFYLAWRKLEIVAALKPEVRWNDPPARLERNREALLILSLIAAIMITDFMFDGFRFALAAGRDPAIAHEARYAIVGASIARGFSGMTPAALATGYQFSYWMQMATVFSFLVLLPVGEHFHIVTALPSLFFARRARSNRVPTVD